jgi:hypothetical protein
MKEFPSILNVNNKNNFRLIYYNRVLCYFRRKIYEHMIKEDENSYFDLNDFCVSNGMKDIKNIEKMVQTLSEELHKLGWKCKRSFGGTALFIYSSDKPPRSCWDDELV